MKIWNRFTKILGPGLISGASDDDPTGIGTYAQGGAQFGLGLSWLALFQFPLMTAIQEMCARIGMTTGSGIVGVIRKRHSKKAVLPVVCLLLVANAITIGADLGAMGSSVQLLAPSIPGAIATIAIAAFVILTEILLPYRVYARMLKFTTLALFAYVGAAFAINTDWSHVAISTFIPHLESSPQFVLMFVAFFGATISPYAFFWQASEEAEEDILKKKITEIGVGKPKITRKELRIMRTDSIVGMAFSQIIMWFIIIVSANTLHVNGITNIQTADQAARSLEPLVHNFPYAGNLAAALFSTGIIGTGLLAIPVLAGSSAYALSDGLGWKQGLGKKFSQARGFYSVIIASTLVGVWINLIHTDPIQALVYASITSGILTVPLLVVILKISNDKEILGNKTNGTLSNVLGIITVAVMAGSVVIMFVLSYIQKFFM